MPKWIYWSPWVSTYGQACLVHLSPRCHPTAFFPWLPWYKIGWETPSITTHKILECLLRDLENSYIYKMIRAINTMSGFPKFVGFCFQRKGITLWTYSRAVPGSWKASLKENLDTSYFTSKQKHRSDSSSPWQSNSSENHHWTKFLSVGFEMYWGLAEMVSRLEHIPENWGSALSTHCRWLTKLSSFHLKPIALYTSKTSEIWRQTTSEYKPWQ